MSNFKISLATLSFLLFSTFVFADNIVVNITGETDFCFGSSTIICANSAPNYSYQWSTGESTNCITVLIAGFFSVTVSDGICSGSTNVNITQSSILTPIISGDDLCLGAETTLSTGIQYDSYQWIGPTGQIINSLGSPWEIEVSEGGFYTLNVTQGTCSAMSSYNLFEVDPPTATVQQNTMACNSLSPQGPNIIDLNQLIFTESDFTIFDQNDQVIPSGIVDFEGQIPGVYTYKYVLDADFPCEVVSYFIDIIVEDCNCPNLTLPNIAQCVSDSTLINLFDFSYSLTETGGSFSLIDSQGNLTFSQPDSNGILMINETLLPGDYTLSYTINNAPLGCPSISMSIFKIFPLPQIALAAPEPICISDTVASTFLMHLNELIIEGEGLWSDQNGNPIDSDFTFNVSPLDTMTFLFSTTNAIAPCSNFSTPITLEFIECIESSISQLDDASIKIYPNPSHNALNINTTSNFDNIELINIYGQVVFSTLFKETIDISELKSGVYYLKLTNSKNHDQQFTQIIKS